LGEFILESLMLGRHVTCQSYYTSLALKSATTEFLLLTFRLFGSGRLRQSSAVDNTIKYGRPLKPIKAAACSDSIRAHITKIDPITQFK